MPEFNLSQYKNSIKELRHELGVGFPANRGGDVVEVQCDPNWFRFNVSDLYLTHMKTGGGDWAEIKKHNYSQMGIADDFDVKRGKIVEGFEQALPKGTKLAMVILATSEAARSQVVYRVVQQVLKNYSLKVPWSTLKDLLIGSWIHNIEENHKTRPIKYGALDTRDYYNEKATNAIKAISGMGFTLD